MEAYFNLYCFSFIGTGNTVTQNIYSQPLPLPCLSAAQPLSPEDDSGIRFWWVLPETVHMAK